MAFLVDRFAEVYYILPYRIPLALKSIQLVTDQLQCLGMGERTWILMLTLKHFLAMGQMTLLYNSKA